MHIIFLTKKKVGVITIIIGLMILLFGIGYTFDGGLRFTGLMQNNIYSLKNYDLPKQKFSYKLPSEWTTTLRDLSFSGIIYHNEFVSSDSYLSGVVEIISTKEAVNTYIDNSKSFKDENSFCQNYNTSSINIQNERGSLVSYDISYTDKPVYNNHDYYIKKGDNIYKISFSARKDKYKDSLTSIYDTIVNSMSFN